MQEWREHPCDAMSARGHHATKSAQRAKSALPSLSEICTALRHFGFVPISDRGHEPAAAMATLIVTVKVLELDASRWHDGLLGATPELGRIRK